MPLSHLSSPEIKQTWELPALRATISHAEDLKAWRKNLYQSMTSRSSNAIARLLGERLQVAEIMQILNKRHDKTRKSKWATLQAIIQYTKGYTCKQDITAEDVRIELENIDRDFSPQRSVTQIIQETEEKAASARIVRDNQFLTVTIAGFETPIIGTVRETIRGLLSVADKPQEKQIPKETSTETPKPIVTAPIIPPRVTIPTVFEPKNPTPRRVDAAILHKIQVAHFERVKTGNPGQKPIVPTRPTQDVSRQTPPPQKNPNKHEKSDQEIMHNHIQTIKQTKDAFKIIDEAKRRATKKGKMDDVIFEGYIRGKDVSILIIMQAIKRLGRYRAWENVVALVMPSKESEKSSITPPKPPPVTTQQTPPTQNTVPITSQPKQPPEEKAITPPQTPPTKIPPVSEQYLPPEVDFEKMDLDTLGLMIIDTQVWINFLQPLCQLHKDKRYADFLAAWYAFKGNEEDDMQIELWNALCEYRKKKNNPLEHVIHIAFELCGIAFSTADGELYTKKYHRKKRIAELLSKNDAYDVLMNDIEDIHSYEELSTRMSVIHLCIPNTADEWLLYEEKISSKCSLGNIVQKELERIYSSRRVASRSAYLREAKKILRAVGRGK